MRVYKNLATILESIAEKAITKPLSIREVLARLDHFGFSIIALILVLPFMQPFPVGPISVLGGVTFAILGVQLLKRNSSPTLPEKILNTSLGVKGWLRIIKICKLIIRWSKKITKPRLEKFVSGNLGVKFEGSILVIGGILMAIPFGVLPLNNFFPGLAILFASLAQFEKDGLFILIAIFWLFFSVFYFSIFIILLYYIGIESIQYLPYRFSNIT
jgi:hypothetical protein